MCFRSLAYKATSNIQYKDSMKHHLKSDETEQPIETDTVDDKGADFGTHTADGSIWRAFLRGMYEGATSITFEDFGRLVIVDLIDELLINIVGGEWFIFIYL